MFSQEIPVKSLVFPIFRLLSKGICAIISGNSEAPSEGACHIDGRDFYHFLRRSDEFANLC